jgi:amino acid transporter|tara:strand:- start:6308 stop:6634 length:327 start_codon:yes stop_codon:yes gene_type:complete
MAIWNRTNARTSSSSDGASPHSDPEKHGHQSDYGKSGVIGTGESKAFNIDNSGVAVHEDHKHLHRGLKSRHITMIAIGGAIGTGLIIGTGKALAQSGYVVLLRTGNCN